jgi:hypothetical protein
MVVKLKKFVAYCECDIGQHLESLDWKDFGYFTLETNTHWCSKGEILELMSSAM